MLTDKVMVLTGASSGIGRATALAATQAGATVVCVARNGEALNQVVDACRDAPGEATDYVADVSHPEDLEELARYVTDRFGGIDIWVNNAAVNMFGPLEEVPVELWHRVIEVNLFGTYHGIRAALPVMREQGHGRIINVSSLVGKLSAPQQSAYVASKHAVRALSNCTRQEVRDLPGVSVCTILPGPLDTPLFQHAANFSGRRVKPPKPVIDARRAADAIVSAAATQRREVVVGASTATNLLFGRLAPGVFEKLVARQVNKDHFEPTPAPDSPGNLMSPDQGHTMVSGGWDRLGHQRGEDAQEAVSNDGHGSTAKTITTLATVGLAGAVGVTAWKSRN